MKKPTVEQMRQELLSAKDRQRNLNRLLKDSTVKKRLYHGTTAHDEYADKEGQAFKQFAGRPTWLAEEPYTAGGYSKGTGSTYPVYAQLKKPLKLPFDANDDAEKAYGAARMLGVDVEHIKRMHNPEKAWEVVNHPSFIDAAENAGYDGIQIKEGGYKTHGVFDPRKIKSATGNRGTYDTKDPDITKAEGGSVKPKLIEDIPNEDWLKGKVDYALQKGRNSYGVPHRGSITGYYDKPVHVPLKVLSKLRGQSNEQENVRPESLDYIRKNWKEVSKQHPYIEVAHNGEAWVSEGNHRIMVANEKGLDSMPVQIRYFDGGQRKNGPLHPSKVLPPDESMVKKANGGPVQPSIDAMRLELAQKRPQGFGRLISQADQALLSLPRQKGTGQEFLRELQKTPGVKPAELEERGLDKALAGMGKVTKAEALKALQDNPPVKLEEVVLSSNAAKMARKADDDLVAWAEAESDQGRRTNFVDAVLRGEPSSRLAPMAASSSDVPEYARNLAVTAERGYSGKAISKFDKYTLPGGENYRELLLKLPTSANPENTYESQHWDEPNVLAHARLTDRIGPNGEKILHVEEVQSDWHQEGRKSGYKTGKEEQQLDEAKWQYSFNKGMQRDFYKYADAYPEGSPERLKYLQQANDLTPKLMKLNSDISRIQRVMEEGVPDAPFKKNWHELMMKRLVNYAAENGYDKIAITPGEEQASRYDLSKQIDSLDYKNNGNGTYELFAVPINRGQNTLAGDRTIKRTVQENELPGILGKELAQKIVSGEGKPHSPTAIPSGYKTLSGFDLQVGGEGMKGFYDRMLPNYLNELGKPYGVKVGKIQVEGGQEMSRGPTGSSMVPTYTPKMVSLHSFDITPQMREAVMTKGLPLYAHGGAIRMADGGLTKGGSMPTLAEMRVALMKRGNPIEMQSIGVNEAPDINPKAYMPPDRVQSFQPPTGGTPVPPAMPIGGIDQSRMMPGQQLMGQQLRPQQGALPGQQAAPEPTGLAPAGAQPGGQSNILSLTPQGQALSALKPAMPQMADGGKVKQGVTMGSPKSTRMVFQAEGPGGVKGINVPRHMWEGSSGVFQSGSRAGKEFKTPGMKDVNAMRAKVYGSENRDPLTIGQIGRIHKDTLAEHFKKPLNEQIAAEKEALGRLREAGHIGKTANTLDESEKLDTVRHEHDEEGRTHVGYASKGVAGHALYTSGHGKNMKHHVINTCPGQTEGCGGGKDAKGIVDTTKGTCFAPVAEAQYPGAAIRRASHEQAKHDPAMTRDWILAHTGSIRDAANSADKKNQRMLFRPNVVDETDTSSRHVIRHLNEQRKAENKPGIIANSYGKTNELHDPENGYYVTHSNVGPKVKQGKEISENIGRDKQRVSNTILAANNKGDFTNEQGNKTPPKGSYMVTNVKRGSPLSKKMQEHITHAKYWSTGRDESDLSDAEKAEGPEGHYGPSGRKTTPEKAHYGHTTLNGRRYDYQKQHILHPRLVQVGENKDGTPHMIPTDSRFKDTEFLPKDRFKTKNGKEAGHILMTTPTESTSNLGHETSFTHHVDEKSIKHAMSNNGEYEIDKPEEQEKARGKEYSAPKPISIVKKAMGGSIESRHPGLSDDDFHAFPERNFAAQRHLAMRRGDDEHETVKKHGMPVVVHKNVDTMRYEMMARRKG